MHRPALLALIVLWAAPSPARACSPVEPGSWVATSIPLADDPAFPHDAAPLVRLGDMTRQSLPTGAAPILLDHSTDPPTEVPVTLDSEERAEPSSQGSVLWTRVVSDAPLVPDREYGLRLTAPDVDAAAQDGMDGLFPPVRFRTTRSFIDQEPRAPDIWIQVLDPGPRPPTPNGNCGGDAGGHDHTLEVHLDGDADPLPHHVWRFFEVDEGTTPDLESLAHREALHAAPLMPFVEEGRALVAWTYPAPEEDDERKCVVSATEDAYGRLSDPGAPQCADPVASCAAGCSVTEPRARAAGWGLLLLAGVRRTRRRGDPRGRRDP